MWTYRPLESIIGQEELQKLQAQRQNIWNFIEEMTNHDEVVCELTMNNTLAEEIDLKYLSYDLIPFSYMDGNLDPFKGLSKEESHFHKRKFRKVYRRAVKYNGLFFPKNSITDIAVDHPADRLKWAQLSKKTQRTWQYDVQQSKNFIVREFLTHQVLEDIGYRYIPESIRNYIRV